MAVVKSELVENVIIIMLLILCGTGAALSIFTRKRPRMALMAFSNSQSSMNSGHTVAKDFRQEKNSFVVPTAMGDKENSGYNHRVRETTKWK